MKAVILAAGKALRFQPLSITTPKPLLKVANKELILYALDALIGLVDEIIIIVGYKRDMIIARLGDNYRGIPIRYITQESLNGTGGAVLLADGLVDDFLVMPADDIYSEQDIRNIAMNKNSILVAHSEHPEFYGCVEISGKYVKRIVEKPKEPKTDLINAGLYHFTREIFDYIKKVDLSIRNEIEITDAISLMENVKHIKVKDYWLPNSYVWDLLKTNTEILRRMESRIEGSVEEGAVVKGKLILGKGSLIRAGAYLEGDIIIGENTVIGPNCFIRGSTAIGNNCRVGNAVEIKNSILMDGSKVGHLSYVGDSILGRNVNFGAGTITANLRHDNKNIKTMIKGELVDTGLRKFGTIVGDKVHTGIHTSIYPGRKLYPETSTLPGEIVKKDKN